MIAIILLFLYVFGSTDAYQLLKLPSFVQHYQYHQQINSELSFISFLQIHYNNGPVVVDNDFNKDMQLPFKTTQVEFSNTINIIVPPNTISVETIPAYKGARHLVYSEVIPQHLSDKSIFQPPRFLAAPCVSSEIKFIG